MKPFMKQRGQSSAGKGSNYVEFETPFNHISVRAYWEKIKTIPRLEEKKHLVLLEDLKKSLQGTEVARELDNPDSNTS